MAEQSYDTDVLIVGAGPSGLMMACQLALRDIPFRIIDKKDRSTNYSGALILQARSIEIFRQMGIAHRAIGGGIFANEIRLIFNRKRTFILPLSNFAPGLTRFPGLLMLEQSVTERILSDFILAKGHTVERGVVLEQVTQDPEKVTCVLKSVNGGPETIKTNYLIGADGAHSTVRKQLKIQFPGKSYPNFIFVTDCKAKTTIPGDQLCFSFSANATTGFFPLRGNRCRIDGVIPSMRDKNEKPGFIDIAEYFAEITGIDAVITNPEWFSVFQQHDRCADKFQINRCFLVGDAAHIHSPVGAQGMNTGLQDAYNLAWKLSLVIRKKALPVLLDTYWSERAVIAKKIVHTTGHVFNLMTSRKLPEKIFRVYVFPTLLKVIFPLLMKYKTLRFFLFRRISQIGIQYRHSFLSQEASFGKFPRQAPEPGERLPYIRYVDKGKVVNIQDKVDGRSFHLFIFGKNPDQDDLLKVAEKYQGLFSIDSIGYSEETGVVYHRLGIKESGYYLIRPDLYIACRSVISDARYLENYLSKFTVFQQTS